jgi:hypothetical protein
LTTLHTRRDDASLEESVERKLTGIVCADVFGLLEENEEATPNVIFAP